MRPIDDRLWAACALLESSVGEDGQGGSAGDRRLKCRATCETDGREIGIDALVMRN
jgi:hypothetical protein